MKKIFTLLLIVCCIGILSCSKKDDNNVTPTPNPEVKSNQCKLLTFGFTKADNPTLLQDIVVQVNSNTIEVKVESSVDITNLKASFTHSPKSIVKIGAIEQVSHTTVNDYSTALTYVVTAEDGTSTNYTVKISKILSNKKQIISFVFEKSKNPSLPFDIVCDIDTVAKKIKYIFPQNIKRDNLIASFTISDKATAKINDIIQVSGSSVNNYNTPLSFTLYSEDGTSVSYELYFPLETIPSIDMSLVQRKLKALNYHKGGYATNGDPLPMPNIVPILSTTWETSKPHTAFAFDCGYIDNSGTIYVSTPLKPEQKAVFPNINAAALYYLCKAYINHYHRNAPMPIWYENGFAYYESGNKPDDEVIKKAIQAYGSGIPHLKDLNDRINFESKNGLAIAYLFGEFMGPFYCWAYFDIIETTATNITVAPWRWNCANFAQLEEKWFRYVDYRMFKPENIRLKWQKESENFTYLTRDIDYSLNFPTFSAILETAYEEYKNKLNISYPEKITVSTMPEAESAYIDGVPSANRITGGTAWSSGVGTSCAANPSDLWRFTHHLRHELAHEFQSLLIKRGKGLTAWLNEGFPEFMAAGGVRKEKPAWLIDDAKKSLANATNYFGHKPTFEDTGVYPNPYFNYYLLGEIMYEFVYSKGGMDAVRAITVDMLEWIASAGYSSPDAFMEDYYTYFKKNWE